MYNVDLRDLSHLADPAVDQMLLPYHLRERRRPGREALYKKALRIAMEDCLSPEQREILHQRFWLGKSVREIAAAQKITGSAASKRIAASIKILKRQISFGIRLHNEISPKNPEDSD